MKGVLFLALATLAVPGLCEELSNAGEGEVSIAIPSGPENSNVEKMEYEVVCNRNGEGPFAHHVYEAADMIHTDGKCYTDHKGCQKIEASYGARVAVCANGGAGEARLDCGDVANRARMLADECQKADDDNKDGYDRVGGRVYLWQTKMGKRVVEAQGYVEISRNK